MFGKLFAPGSKVMEVDVTEASRRQDAGAVLVDVPEPEEWRAGHAQGARHIPLGELSRRAGELPKEREILLICRGGNRSRTAAQLLAWAGYERVVNVHGGMMAWMRPSLPLG